jgi:hypothetical protein
MTPAQFRDLLLGQTDAELLGPCLHDSQAPYVFQPRLAAWDEFREELVSGLGVARDDIRVVGSGRFGFSLRPGRNLRTFPDTSDIDVAVINASLFDQLWAALLEAAYPRPPITEHLGGWLGKRRNELYTGWLTPLKINLDISIVGVRARPVIDFNFRWFRTLKQASRHPLRRHEDISSRLYRTWRHAELYHLNSLAALRSSLLEQ